MTQTMEQLSSTIEFRLSTIIFTLSMIFVAFGDVQSRSLGKGYQEHTVNDLALSTGNPTRVADSMAYCHRASTV